MARRHWQRVILAVAPLLATSSSAASALVIGIVPLRGKEAPGNSTWRG